MSIFAQSEDMAFYTEEFNRPGSTFFSRLEVLETVRNANLTGIGEFYHEALRTLIGVLPNANTWDERAAAAASARILVHGLAAETYLPAASDIWVLIQNFDVVHAINDGIVMHDALIALGQIDSRDHIPYIVRRLDSFNRDHTNDVATRLRFQRGVAGAIIALETLQDPSGFAPVFFTSIGWFDSAIRNMAANALPNIVEDPADIIIALIRDASNNPAVKYEAWRGMLRTNAPDSSKARVAAAALDVGWGFLTANLEFQRQLREMRLSAIDTIRVMGVADSSVYANLQRSYRNNFTAIAPDYDEIHRTLAALSASGSDEAVDLLFGFLHELHHRRQFGPWGMRERQVLQMLIPALGASRTQSVQAIALLSAIQRSGDYTHVEQGWARNALAALGF